MALTSKYVDGGWSWVILFASCSVEFLYVGVLKSLSVLLPSLTDQFQTRILIVGMLITSIGSVKDFSSPVVGFLATFVEYRHLGMAGGLIVGLSIASASFVSNVQLLTLFLSIFSGIGFALVKLPATYILSQYFDELYPFASGLFYASGSLGLTVCAPITRFLLEAYGWRGTLLLIGAINFNLVIFCSLFRLHSHDAYVKNPTASLITQFDDHTNYSSMSDKKEDHAFGWRNESVESNIKKYNKWFNLSGISLFRNFSFVAASLACASYAASMTGWTVYFIPHCLNKGLSLSEATSAASVAGITCFVGHFIHTPFLKKQLITVRVAIYTSALIAGFIIFLDKFSSSFVAIVIINSVYTFGIGVNYLFDVHMKSIMEHDSLGKAFGWRTAVLGIFRPLTGFIIGWMYEQTGSYDVGFVFIGALPLVAVSMLGVDHLLEKGIFKGKTT